MNPLSLESRLKAEVVSFSGKVAIYANDFQGHCIQINADESFEAGSCIKVFILLELFRQIHARLVNPKALLHTSETYHVTGSGILRFIGPGAALSIEHLAIFMIAISDNVAANMLIECLGIDNINRTAHAYGFTKTWLYNPIDFEHYEHLGDTTPRDYGVFFEKLHSRALINEEASTRMLQILKTQQYNRMLTKDFPQYYLDSEDTGDEELIYLASKSGSMDSARNDGGLIHTPYGAYVTVIFTKEFKDPLYYNEHESFRYGGKASRLIFDQFLALKGKFA